MRLAAEMADDYELVHKSKFGFQHQFQSERVRNWEKEKSSGGKGKGDHVGDVKDSLPQVKKETYEGGRKIKNLRCFRCNKVGHTMLHVGGLRKALGRLIW